MMNPVQIRSLRAEVANLRAAERAALAEVDKRALQQVAVVEDMRAAQQRREAMWEREIQAQAEKVKVNSQLYNDCCRTRGV